MRKFFSIFFIVFALIHMPEYFKASEVLECWEPKTGRTLSRESIGFRSASAWDIIVEYEHNNEIQQTLVKNVGWSYFHHIVDPSEIIFYVNLGNLSEGFFDPERKHTRAGNLISGSFLGLIITLLTNFAIAKKYLEKICRNEVPKYSE